MRNMEDKLHAKQYMECNHCGELIPEKTRRCPHCGRLHDPGGDPCHSLVFRTFHGQSGGICKRFRAAGSVPLQQRGGFPAGMTGGWTALLVGDGA